MENELKIGGIYRHFKGNDKLNKIEKIAINSETLEEWVVYTALYGDKKTWIRPKYMFFEKVPDGKENPNNQKYRFEYLGDEI